MSNYHSIIRNYGEPQSNFNAELAIKALSYKQDKYDANAAKIQEAMNQYGNIDFARPEDRQNFYNKINNHIENIEGLKGADLSSAAITNSITAHISKALDQETLKHVGYTQAYRQFGKEYAELQKKDPDAVSQTNYQDAVKMSGLDLYMNGESDDINTSMLRVNPYSDYQSNLLKKAQELKTLMPDQTVQFEDANGDMVERTVKTLTVAEWQKYLPQYLSQQDRDQMAIDGRALFNWDDEQAKARAKEMITEANVKPQENINRLSIIANDPNETEQAREQAQSLIDENQKQIDTNIRNISSFKTATQLGSYLMEQNVINTTAYAIGREPDIKYVKDHRNTTEIKAAEAKNQNNPLTSGLNVSSLFTNTGQEITDADFYKASNDAEIRWTQAVNSTLNSLDSNTQAQVKRNAQIIKAEREKDGVRITEAEALQEALFKTKLPVGQAAELQRMYDEHNAFTIAEANAQRAQEKSVFSDPSKVKDFYENTVGQWFGKGIQMLGTDVKTYLKSKGVKDVESFQTFLNSEDSQEFKGAVNSNMFLSNQSAVVGSHVTNIGTALSTNGHIGRFNKENLFEFNRLVASLGEDGIGLTDILEFRAASLDVRGMLSSGPLLPVPKYKDTGTVLTEQQVLDTLGDFQENMFVSLKPGAENTKTGQALIKAIENKDFAVPTNFNLRLTPDSHFYEDSTIRKMLSYDENQKGFKEKLGVEAAAIKGMNMVTVMIPETAAEVQKDARFKEAQSLVSSPSITGGTPFKLLYGQPIRIRENLGADSVTISQLTGATQGGKLVEQFNEVVIDKKLFSELAPTLSGSVELAQSDKRLDFNRGKTKTSLPISYIDLQDERTMMDAINYTGIGQNVAQFLSKDDTRASLMQNFSGSIYAPNAPRQYAQSFDLALNNAGEFRAEIVQEGGQAYINLKVGQTEKKNGRNQTTYKDVYKIPTYRAGSSEEIERMLYATPQVFLGVALTAIAADLEEGRIQAYERFQKAIQHLQQ